MVSPSSGYCGMAPLLALTDIDRREVRTCFKRVCVSHVLSGKQKQDNMSLVLPEFTAAL
jgi:hypothetical protein